MIKANLPRLCEGCGDLRQIARTFSAQLQAAEAVKNSLSGGTELEKLRPALAQVLAAGERQCQELLRMAQAVDAACQYYAACERRIVDECENAVFSYPSRSVQFVQLADTADALRDMGLM